MSNGMKKNLELKMNVEEKNKPNNLQAINTPTNQSLNKHYTTNFIKNPKEADIKTANGLNSPQEKANNINTGFQPKPHEVKRNAGKFLFN